ncbi:MAG: hypothetical protein ABSH28_16210 [Acidobacteriota bacterium]|jgi:hypothetical protein
MERRRGIEGNTHGEFPASIMETAREENVPVIDLWSMSKKLYTAMGEQVGEAFADPTHHRNYGVYELSKCVVQGIKDNRLPLADHIVDDFGTFDPADPDPFASFRVPASAGRMETRGGAAPKSPARP